MLLNTEVGAEVGVYFDFSMRSFRSAGLAYSK
jgi:hypothetical protein